MRTRFAAAALLALLSSHAFAYDATKANRYPSPDLYRPNTDSLTINGPVDTFDKSTKGATTDFVARFWRQRNGSEFSPFDYCTAVCGQGTTNDTAAVQAAFDAMKAAQAAGVQGPVLNLRGGMFAVSAAAKMTGAPYSMIFGNGSIIAYNGYTGDLIDFSGTTATTKLKFIGLTLNGYNTATNLIKMGPKTQGTTVMYSGFYGWKGVAFLDPTTVAATENQISNNVFQGGSNVNQGTAIELFGNDSEVNDNVIYNVATGIRTHAASHTISRNHIYSVDVNIPIPLIDADTGDQMQVIGNYLDEGFVRFASPAGLQLNDNRFLFGGTVAASAYSPIVLRPRTSNYALSDFLVMGNRFRSLDSAAPLYTPVKVDTTPANSGDPAAAIVICYSCYMKDNGFYGFQEQSTEPRGVASGTNTSTFPVDLTAKVPFLTLTGIDSVVCTGPGYNVISSTGIGATAPYKNTIYINFTSPQTGSCRVRATVNSN